MISFKDRCILLSIVMSLMTLAYLASNYWAEVRDPYNLYSIVEQYLPFIPVTVYIYTIAYVGLLASPLLLVTKKDDFHSLLKQILIISLASCLVFIIFPTTTWRPNLNVDGFTSQVLNYLWVIDSPNNCCPSLHVSLAALFGYFLHAKKYWKTWPLVITGSVIISTVLTKQHCVIDVVGGLAVMATTWYVIETRNK